MDGIFKILAAASRILMNKDLARRLVQETGIPVAVCTA
jgi:hypothetical protein